MLLRMAFEAAESAAEMIEVDLRSRAEKFRGLAQDQYWTLFVQQRKVSKARPWQYREHLHVSRQSMAVTASEGWKCRVPPCGSGGRDRRTHCWRPILEAHADMADAIGRLTSNLRRNVLRLEPSLQHFQATVICGMLAVCFSELAQAGHALEVAAG